MDVRIAVGRRCLGGSGLHLTVVRGYKNVEVQMGMPGWVEMGVGGAKELFETVASQDGFRRHLEGA